MATFSIVPGKNGTKLLKMLQNVSGKGELSQSGRSFIIAQSEPKFQPIEGSDGLSIMFMITRKKKAPAKKARKSDED